MVPLRFVGEAFDQKVDFDNGTQTITLTDFGPVQKPVLSASDIEKQWFGPWFFSSGGFSITFTNYDSKTHLLTGVFEDSIIGKVSISGIIHPNSGVYEGIVTNKDGIRLELTMHIESTKLQIDGTTPLTGSR